jgi:hypothetical protein
MFRLEYLNEFKVRIEHTRGEVRRRSIQKFDMRTSLMEAQARACLKTAQFVRNMTHISYKFGVVGAVTSDRKRAIIE